MTSPVNHRVEYVNTNPEIARLHEQIARLKASETAASREMAARMFQMHAHSQRDYLMPCLNVLRNAVGALPDHNREDATAAIAYVIDRLGYR